jgi:hypothetical protein
LTFYHYAFANDPNYMTLKPEAIAKLEVVVCRTLEFKLYVHSALNSINHIKNIFAKKFGDFMNDHSHPLFETFISAEDYALLHFRSLELTFCHTPNAIACASVDLVLQKKG